MEATLYSLDVFQKDIQFLFRGNLDKTVGVFKSIKNNLRKPLIRQVVQRCRGDGSPVEVGAASDCVVAEIFLGFLIAKIFKRIRPQQVTHGSKGWWLLEPVQLNGKEDEI